MSSTSKVGVLFLPRGLLLLVVGTLLLTVTSSREVLAFIFPFFFFSLIAVSLARWRRWAGSRRGRHAVRPDLAGHPAGNHRPGAGRACCWCCWPAPRASTHPAAWAPVGGWLLDVFAKIITIVLWPSNR